MQTENLHKFTVAEYLALYEKGVLKNSDRTQLVNGDILPLSPHRVQAQRNSEFNF